MTEMEKKTAIEPIALVEDGNTFLSQEELDEYRGQKVLLAWEENAYV